MSTQASTGTPTTGIPTPAKINGARRMGVTFNPGKDPRIDDIKKKFAELHDLIDTYCTSQLQSPLVDDAIARQEIARACAMALTDLQKAKWATVEALTR